MMIYSFFHHEQFPSQNEIESFLLPPKLLELTYLINGLVEIVRNSRNSWSKRVYVSPFYAFRCFYRAFHEIVKKLVTGS